MLFAERLFVLVRTVLRFVRNLLSWYRSFFVGDFDHGLQGQHETRDTFRANGNFPGIRFVPVEFNADRAHARLDTVQASGNAHLLAIEKDRGSSRVRPHIEQGVPPLTGLYPD